jgi:hypothetical protein
MSEQMTSLSGKRSSSEGTVATIDGAGVCASVGTAVGVGAAVDVGAAVGVGAAVAQPLAISPKTSRTGANRVLRTMPSLLCMGGAALLCGRYTVRDR